VIVDCGPISASHHCFSQPPGATILSVEPHSENLALLKINLAEVPRILPIRACVTGTPQGGAIDCRPTRMGNRIATDARGVLVPAITIEELCKQNGIEKIDLLKLDIEGAKEQVLQNGTFLARTEHQSLRLDFEKGDSRIVQ
jgi:FkbM family methyltransferase